MRYYLIILAFALLFAGCTSKDELAEALMESQNISITWKGAVQVTYNADTFQLGYNSANNEYRVYDDNLTNWFIVKCSQKPMTEGETVVADVSWTGEKSIKNFTGKTFKVAKTDEQGHVWLQNSSDKIGIIIKNIK